MPEVQQLLADYAKTGSETAFREVVDRFLNLVYSTAIRLVNGDSHLAEDVTQKVFADLAKMAGALSGDVMLGGWLHRHTCFVAGKTIRTERRRRAREQEAMAMNETEDHSAANLKALTPVLDEAIDQLGARDRQAILLRYFEQRDLREVGAALGGNEDSARKRVSRALEKLRELLKRRGVSLSAAALGTALGAQAVSAAPQGLAIAVSASALATVAAGGGTALTFLHIMSMTKIQGGIIAAITVALTIPLALQYRTQTELRAENQALRAQAGQIDVLAAENKRLSNLVAKAAKPASAAGKDQSLELMKLRGEVGVLRKTADEAVAAAAKVPTESPLSGITSNPEMSKMIRDQQKMGLGMVYKEFGKQAKLSAEKMEALNNLLADDVMTNISHITDVLRDGKTPEQMDEVFARQEAELREKVKALVGPEASEQFQDYNRNLLSFLTSEQFKETLKGEPAAKEAQTKKMYDLMRQEASKALAAQGLSEDYQLVPTLNFRNIASEQQADKNLAVLDSIYEQVQIGAASFLSPEELGKFGDMRKAAIANNRVALTLNRKLMAPPSK